VVGRGTSALPAPAVRRVGRLTYLSDLSATLRW
jgi:hypothetical protein